jgi:hypothetical protein
VFPLIPLPIKEAMMINPFQPQLIREVRFPLIPLPIKEAIPVILNPYSA